MVLTATSFRFNSSCSRSNHLDECVDVFPSSFTNSSLECKRLRRITSRNVSMLTSPPETSSTNFLILEGVVHIKTLKPKSKAYKYNTITTGAPIKHNRLLLHRKEMFSKWTKTAQKGTTKKVGTAVVRESKRLAFFPMLGDRYCVGSISWFVRWIVVCNSCAAVESVQDTIIVILISGSILSAPISRANGITDVKAKIKPAPIEIAICADNDVEVGSCSLLGFDSCRSETFSFLGSS
mmetsp:Transcript_3897/g.8482  ORF Transcript_3897/g.8482 Transcript_3897/m.8482 type:complete len:237 (-) Transcript_3897:239-949(-)